jgi:hypothetical protein
MRGKVFTIMVEAGRAAAGPASTVTSVAARYRFGHES